MNKYINMNDLCEFANNQKDKKIDANDIARFTYVNICKNINAHWIPLEPEIGMYACSNCEHKILKCECNFCPNCGASMSKNNMCDTVSNNKNISTINEEFIELVKSNSQLPIYAYVDSYICGAWYDYNWYLGGFGRSQLATILISDDFKRVYEDKEEFKEDYYNMHEYEWSDLTDEEIEKLLDEICESQPWEDCILVCIGTV